MLKKDAKIVFVFISVMALILHAAIAGMVAIDEDYFLEKSFAQEGEQEAQQQQTETEVGEEQAAQVTDDQTNSISPPADESETSAVQEGTQNDELPYAEPSAQCNEGEVLLDGICVSETPLPQPPTETPTPTPIEEPVDTGTDATENETETGTDDNMGNIVEEDLDIINNTNTDNGTNTDDNNNNNSTQTPLPRNNHTQVDTPQNNTNSTSTPINNPPVAIATVSKQSVCEGERVILDASNSHDPDDGDSIVSYSWSVEETDDEDSFPRIINRDSVKTAVETRNTLNSAAGGVGIELFVEDKNGTMSNDFVSFRIEKCPTGGNDGNNDQGQQKATTKTTTIEATAECGIISETINLAGQLAPKGIRIIGFFDQCQLDMASLLLNIPNDKDLKLIAGSIDFQNAPQARDNNDAVFVDMVKMRQLSSTQGLYKTSIEDPLIGKDLVTKQPKELSNINTIVLWNDDAKDAISFGSGSAVGMSISFEK
jgi:hypothetical protein